MQNQALRWVIETEPDAMTTAKHFSDMNGASVELAGVTSIPNAEFVARFPGVKGRRFDGYAMLVGRPATETPVYVQGKGWTATTLPVTRSIAYKGRPSLHECDARCMNATGRTMNCECSCGGKNHGAGAFRCAQVA